MLEQLYIKNVALIDETLIEFNKGLNILSGETGAGKSIIIGSIAFVLGGRATKDFIKKDCEQAKVEALLSIKSNDILNYLIDFGINIEEDNSILITRIYTKNGKNICKINGKPATISMIKEIAEKLIDIHGQHEHQSLLNPKKHIVLLDKFCDENLINLKDSLFNEIVCYKKILNEIAEISIGKNKQDIIDFLKFQIDEIESANLKIEEEKTLIIERNIILESVNLKKHYEKVLQLLSISDDLSAMDKIYIAINHIQELSNIDSKNTYLLNEIQEIYARLEDVVLCLKKNFENINDNTQELNFIEERLDLIQKLKKKYGNSINDILNFSLKNQKKLENYLNSSEKLEKLNLKKDKCEKNIKNICKNISEIRKNTALNLENKIEKHLFDLGMKNTKFKIDISNKNTFNKNGFDKVEFLISTNLGENLKPLSKIASGGEMSRIMLSLKAVLSVADNIETFIFDEIDSGISGRTAQMVAEKLCLLSKSNQILCITHLPQIATMGDSHFLIEKSSNFIDNITNTTINLLNYDETVNEIARMIAGAEITNSTIISAKEMIQQANNIKNKY